MIYAATLEDLQTVTNLIQRTITKCYPNYYGEKTVAYFLKSHAEDVIKQDLQHAAVYLMESDGYLVGTGTIKENEIKHLFILPQYQHHKFGSELLECLEDELATKDVEIAQIDVHAHALGWLQARGYSIIAEKTMDADGEQLPYFKVEKAVTAMNLDHLYQGLMF